MKKTICADALRHFPEQWQLSPALDTGGFVFLSGVTGWRFDGTVVSDPARQFRDTFEHPGETLAAARLTFEDIVEMTTYHINLRKHPDAFIKVKDQFIHPPYPAWSAIGTTGLITEGALAEIRVICCRDLRGEEGLSLPLCCR
jgi:enamine deaminase RidA (YjgF/YER057c/UK114 family)